MTRPATLEDALQALDEKNRRQGRAERLLRLRYQGWSHKMVLEATKEPGKRSGWADSPAAWAEQLDVYSHGIIPPTTNKRTGRIRREAKKVFLSRFGLYQD